MNNPDFSERFGKMARNVPDLERLISRIHAGRCKQADFLKVLDAFEKISTGFVRLIQLAERFEGKSVAHLLKTCPDLTPFMENLRAMYTLPDGGKPFICWKSFLDHVLKHLPSAIIPTKGASAVCDEAADAVDAAEEALDDILEQYKAQTKCKTLSYWHSAQGQKVEPFLPYLMSGREKWADLECSSRKSTTYKPLQAASRRLPTGPRRREPRYVTSMSLLTDQELTKSSPLLRLSPDM